MAIHGIVSTYFGDLEYDIGKTLQWMTPFFDTLYILDSNSADSSRQYIIDWERQAPSAKYSYFPSPFFSPAGAVAWRQTAFARAKVAWSYDPEDWVLFVDGTECLNVYHSPPLPGTLTEVAADGTTGILTFQTVDPHGAEPGNRGDIVGANLTLAAIPADSYAHVQGDAETTWTIVHNLGGQPVIDNLVTDPVLDPEVDSYSYTYVDSNTVAITFSVAVSGSVDLLRAEIPAVTHVLDGSYEILSTPSTTEFTVQGIGVNYTTVSTPLDDRSPDPAPAVSITAEPAAFYAGDLFQSWLLEEIAAAEADGKDRISFPGWALVRSSPVQTGFYRLAQTALSEQMTAENSGIPGLAIDEAGFRTVPVPYCDEFYLPMDSLVRLVKVSALNDSGFPWSDIDQPQESFVDAYPADRLSLISYAYVRWAENPTDMTQAYDPDAPNYVVGDEIDPPLRPISQSADLGFFLRTLISGVRPVAGAPTTWSSADGDGVSPEVDGVKELDLVLVEKYRYRPPQPGETPVYTFVGYQSYGGTPLYPGVLRANLREGLWYVKRPGQAISIPVSKAALVDNVVTLTTVGSHFLRPGTDITVFGVDAGVDLAQAIFDGKYSIASVPTPTTLTYARDAGAVDTVLETVVAPTGQVVTMPPAFGPIPWNYLTNSFNTQDPIVWINGAP